MAPFLKGQLDFTGASKKRSSISGNLADLEIWPHMEAVNSSGSQSPKALSFVHEYSASFHFLSIERERADCG